MSGQSRQIKMKRMRREKKALNGSSKRECFEQQQQQKKSTKNSQKEVTWVCALSLKNRKPVRNKMNSRSLLWLMKTIEQASKKWQHLRRRRRIQAWKKATFSKQQELKVEIIRAKKRQAYTTREIFKWKNLQSKFDWIYSFDSKTIAMVLVIACLIVHSPYTSTDICARKNCVQKWCYTPNEIHKSIKNRLPWVRERAHKRATKMHILHIWCY